MLAVNNSADIRNHLSSERFNGKNIGFVPTMGALHQGHFALVEKSLQENDITVVSIYVNPTQFNNQDDYNHYPRHIEQDQKTLRLMGVDYLFSPTDQEMYPFGEEKMSVDVGQLGETMEGAFRPGHFKGVCKIVSKLFNVIQPDKVYFGQKDYQQLVIISHLIHEFFWNIDLEMVPTERDKNGLALSSRNARLSEESLQLASNLYQALYIGKESLLEQEDPEMVKNQIRSYLATCPGIELEYCEIVYSNDLSIVEIVEKDRQYAICIAAKVEGIRLIDNLLVNL